MKLWEWGSLAWACVNLVSVGSVGCDVFGWINVGLLVLALLMDSRSNVAVTKVCPYAL